MERIEVRKGQFHIIFRCDYCQKPKSEIESHYKRNKRHFCKQECYSKFRAEKLPKEEQHRFGTGNTPEERQLRRRVRSETNHAIREGKLIRKPCEVCGKEAEAHHPDYSKPLEVKWLCFKHHRDEHKRIYENPELLK